MGRGREVASAVANAAPLTIHLAIALSFVPMRGKGLKIACAELDVLRAHAFLMMSLASLGMFFAG